jgi:uncharacterized RDD family membrane protein YckC
MMISDNVMYATLAQRVIASLRTILEIVLCSLVLTIGLHVVPIDEIMTQNGISQAWADAVAIFVIWGIPILGMFTTSIFARRTLGMRKRGLIFKAANGHDITILHCGLRLIAGCVFLPVAPLSLVLAIRDSRRRTLADLLCGTIVCAKSKDIEVSCANCGFVQQGLSGLRCPKCDAMFDQNCGEGEQK